MHISLHNIESITIDEPELLETGTWVRHVEIKTNELGEVVTTSMSLFAASKDCLEVPDRELVEFYATPSDDETYEAVTKELAEFNHQEEMEARYREKHDA